jgi:NAD-dependent SIR2 family protein deacetylase
MGKTIKYLQYSVTRDILFVFGAGASHPDGVPLQRDILPTILKDEEIAHSEIGKIVIKFIKDNFAYDEAANSYPRLESVFLFLEHFIQQNESLNKTYTNDVIHKVKEYLIKLIYFIINKKSEKKSGIYGKFWEEVERRNKNISIITLNYDTLLEQAFEPLFKRVGYIDYSIYLMNYNGLDELKYFNFWINPNKPVETEENENPVPFKIIKLHGSLNWKYCNCCNQTLLTPWNKEIDLNKGKLTWYSKKRDAKFEYVCPLDGTDFETLILTPSFTQKINHRVVTQLLSEAGREIRVAKKIVFIGYSLSDADVHIRALFKKHLQRGTKVTVINPRITKALMLKYQSIAPKAEFINSSFEKFVKNKELLDITFGF